MRHTATLLMLFVFTYSNLYSQSSVPPANGDGSEANPYEIATLNNLYWLSQNSTEWDKHYIQTADIDASSTSTWDDGDGGSAEGFSPIGEFDLNDFNGSYDGQGHLITNLYINRAAYFQGLFASIKNAEIKNLGLENADITGQRRVGAIAGRSEQSTIERCFSTGNVTATEAYAGGIVGENYYYGNIFNCYSRCAVNATGSWGGGITGSSGNVCEIINCYSTGTVNGTATIGGIVGSNVSTVDNCFWDTSTSGIASSDGGTGKTTVEMIDMATYTDTTTPGLDEAWDFPGYPNDDNGTASIWEMDAALNNGYPTLSWQYASTATIIMHSIDSINSTEAYITCEITNNGGADVTAAGLCWNTTGTPDIGDIISDEGAVSGIINTSMTGLSSGGTYYVRPFVTNSEGTTYGNEIVFKTTPASGSGTESDPYEISSMEELAWLMGNQKVWDQHFVQTASIDASESQNWFAYKGFYPVGTNTARFTGSYNGRGNVIDNLKINRPDDDYLALFGRASGAAFDSIPVTNINVVGSPDASGHYLGSILAYGSNVSISNCSSTGEITGCTGGGIAGNVSGNSILENCHANCVLNISEGGGLLGKAANFSVIKNSNTEGSVNAINYAGGLIGRFTADSVINCYSTASVVCEYDYAGGLIGHFENGIYVGNSYSNNVVQGGKNYVGGLIGYLDSDALIEECYSEGTVEGVTYVGGLIGSCINNATIMNCYSHASAAASSSCAGGLIGKIAFTSVYNSYSTGSVSGSAHYGGLIGSSFNGTTENCFWDKETSSISFSEGAEGKTTAEMKDVATFTDESTPGLTTAWDFLKNPNDDISFNDHWNITTGINNGYPYFSNDYLARVITSTATNIAVDSITSGGNAISDGGSAITEKGVCWSMAAPPVTLDSMLAVGTGTGAFSVNITGLDTSTTYYVRAYAINAIDTSFGNVDTVTTLKAAQSIIFEPISEKTYGDTVFTLSASATSGLDVSFKSSNPEVAMVSNDSVTITGVGTTTITASQPGNASFAAADDMEHALVVDKDTLWATAHDKSKTYGQTNPELTYNYSDFAYDEDSTVIDIPPVISTTATATTNAGAAEIEISGGTDDNYTIIHVNGTLTIQKDTVTVTAHDKSRVYGSENPEFTWEYTGFANGEDASVIDQDPLLSTSADTLADAGTYPIELSGGNDNNYEMKFVNGTLTIQKAALVAHVKDRFKYYGEPNPDFPVQYSGFVNNEDTSVIDELPVASTIATETSDVGTYDIILTGGNDNNYDISLLNGVLTIQKSDQSITFDIPDRVPADTGSIELNASASSGLPVEYQISNPSAVSLNGNTLQILSAGITNITISQSGNSNYNPASIEIQLIIDEVTGIKHSLTVTKIFPNPVKNLLYLDFSNNMDSPKHYIITNIHGQVMLSDTLEKNQIDVSGFEPGLYVILIDSQKFRIIKD